jgi:PBSX family phage terminase large subunit
VTTALTHRYTPRGTARDLFACRDPEVLVSGPAGTGKSRGCLEKLHMMALLNPGLRGLIVRKTLASLGSTALVTWRTHVVAEALATGVVAFYGGSPQEAASYRYTNGSVITVGGMDRSTRIMSSEYDIVYVQEATELEESDWEAITTRLRNGKVSFQQLLADCNPDAPHHWLKVRCDAGKTLMLDSRHEDNPLLFDDTGALTEIGTAYIGKLDNLTGVRYQRLRRGLWVAAEGLIYEEWDPVRHLVDPFPIPAAWTRYWSVDFGFTNPLVLQCWAEDPDGRLYLYRELYRTKRLVEDHARDILKLVRDVKQTWREPRPRAIICDHDAEDRATLERHLGMSTVPAQKTVSDGIQAVATRLRIDGTGRPRIGVFRDAVVARDHELVDQRKPACTAEEIVGYVWDTGAGKKIKETPLKENDHGCDALRYMVAHLDLGARPRVRFL